jgi:hypothetical protein
MKDACIKILFGVILVLYGVSGLRLNELHATEKYFPCEGYYGSPEVNCGPNSEVSAGECFHNVGPNTCTSGAEYSCSTVSDYWCHSDDECSETRDESAACGVANYADDAELWYFRCPSGWTQQNGCTCERVTNPENTHPITWKAFVAGGTTCD